MCRWAVIITLVPAPQYAQGTGHATERSLGPSIVAYDLVRSRSETPKSAIALSAMIGQRVGPHGRLRAIATVWASLPGGDPVSICVPLPGGGCDSSRPIVPARLFMGEVQAVLRVLPVVPLFGVAGAGLALPVARGSDSMPSHRALLRVGAELGDGRRWHGLRLQATRLTFPSRLSDLRSATTVGILFRF